MEDKDSYLRDLLRNQMKGIEDEHYISELKPLLIKISKRIAKKDYGSIMIIKTGKLDYEVLQPQDIHFNIFKIENQRRLEQLASVMDGAFIFDVKGNLIATSAKISNTKPFVGFGTKHSAAFTASLNGNIVILTSEEDNEVKLFEKGKMTNTDLDNILEKKSRKEFNFLTSLGVGTISIITVSVVSTSIPSLSPFIYILSSMPAGLTIFTSIHAAFSYLKGIDRATRWKKILRLSIGFVFIALGIYLMFSSIIFNLGFGIISVVLGFIVAFSKIKLRINKEK